MSAETVADLLQGKSCLQADGMLVTIGPRDSVRAATVLMNEHGVGSVLVTEGDRLVGMFTERDVLRRVVAESRSPDRTSVADVMTRDVFCCRPDTPLEDVAESMRLRRIRHLPAVGDDGRIRGIVSIGDINAHRFAVCEISLHQVEDYILRRA